MNPFHTAVVALGSNLQAPAEQVAAAVQTLAQHPNIRMQRCSSLYLSAPVGYADQPDFVNAVCVLATDLAAEALLQLLHDIEARFGRERSFRNAPRTLDLDLIDYHHEQRDDPQLTLPHPRAHKRSFVMLPLAEIAPDYVIGTHGTAQALADKLGIDGISRMGGLV